MKVSAVFVLFAASIVVVLVSAATIGQVNALRRTLGMTTLGPSKTRPAKRTMPMPSSIGTCPASYSPNNAQCCTVVVEVTTPAGKLILDELGLTGTGITGKVGSGCTTYYKGTACINNPLCCSIVASISTGIGLTVTAVAGCTAQNS